MPQCIAKFKHRQFKMKRFLSQNSLVNFLLSLFKTLNEQRQLCEKKVDFFVQTTLTFVQTKFTLCTNLNFLRTTSSLYKQRQLCAKNIDFVQRSSTLCKQRPHLCEQHRLAHEDTRNYRFTCVLYMSLWLGY